MQQPSLPSVQRRSASTLWSFITACSVATAASFGASALANGFLFWASWRANYFMIASPADVVMGGFAIFAQLPWLFAAVWTLIYVVVRSTAWAASQALMSSRFIDSPLEISPSDERLFFWHAMAFAVVLAAPVSLWGFSDWDKSLWSLLNARVESPYVYRTGLRIAAESDLPSTCVGRPVLWMGASSAVLDCEQGVRVIHKLDPLVTELGTSVPTEAP